MQALAEVVDWPFARSHAGFEALVGYLQSDGARGMRHSELERELLERGRELLRVLFQEHLDLRGPAPAQDAVCAPDGAVRTRARLQERDLESVFGTVALRRLGYAGEGEESLHPADADLNLPRQRYSHEVERRAAEEIAKGSFEETQAALASQTGEVVPKRQLEEVAKRAAQDFDRFYEQRPLDAEARGALVVMTTDGKGVVMRREDLREPTRKAAERKRQKLSKRLAKGEKRNAKRMATVASVYAIDPFVRTPEQIVRGLTGVGSAEQPQGITASRPRPEQKRTWASLEKEPEQVIEEAFREAQRRDPGHEKMRVALVDGNQTQLRLIGKLSKRFGVAVTIVLDIVHVAQYLWAAALAFYAEGDPEREMWVAQRLTEILRGRASVVAAAMRRSATRRRLTAPQRQAVDKCARYLLRYKAYLRYHDYLAAGFPIATGVIEGACRHLVKDRMDITGARWSLAGAEAVLRLRALRASGDFDQYWRFHEDQEYRRNHVARYADGRVPSIKAPKRDPRHLKIVKK